VPAVSEAQGNPREEELQVTAPATTERSPADDRQDVEVASKSLTDAVRLRDPVGVLSIYVDADPTTRGGGARPAWEVQIRHDLRSIESRLRADGHHREADLVGSGLDDELAGLCDPGSSGRGRAVFVPLSGGDRQRFRLQVPLLNRATCAKMADVGPLLAALEAGRPAGLIGVSRERLRVVDLRLGLAEDLLWLELEPGAGQRHRAAPGSQGNPLARQPAGADRDRHRRRLTERQLRRLTGAGERIRRLAAEQDWDLAIIQGDARLAKPLRAALEGDLHVETADGSLEWMTATEVGSATAADIARIRDGHLRGLVAAVCDAALGGGPATIGAGDTLHALGERRVARLFIDSEARLHGHRTSDGRLAVASELLPGVAVADHLPEPHLASRMIETALDSGARVTPVFPEASSYLRHFDGVAALLRW
jgi:hypothetical protein